MNIDFKVYLFLALGCLFSILFFSFILNFLGSKIKINKKRGIGVIAFIILLFGSNYLYHIHTSQIIIEENKIKISAFSYSKVFYISDVKDGVIFNEELKNGFSLKQKIKGVSLYKYKVGDFKLDNNQRAFVLISPPPYLVLRLKNNEIVIFSQPENDQLVEKLISIKLF